MYNPTYAFSRIHQLTSEENDKKEVADVEDGPPPVKKVAKSSDSVPSDQWTQIKLLKVATLSYSPVSGNNGGGD